jgi:hypothetical protein
VLTEGAPAELDPPPAAGVVVFVGGSVRGDVVVVGGGDCLVVVVGTVVVLVTGGGGVLPPVSLRGGGEAWVTTVVVVLPSGLTETTVVGALEEGVSVGDGGPPRVDGPPGVGVPGTVWTPAGEVPWPPGAPVPPAVVAGAGPASSATAANAVATTSPATPRTTYPARFGLLLFGGAVVSILVMRELESDPSGRGIEAPRRSGRQQKLAARGRQRITACPSGGTREGDLGGEIITVSAAFAQVGSLRDHSAQSICPERMNV